MQTAPVNGAARWYAQLPGAAQFTAFRILRLISVLSSYLLMENTIQMALGKANRGNELQNRVFEDCSWRFYMLETAQLPF